MFREGSSRKIVIENKLKTKSSPGYSFADKITFVVRVNKATSHVTPMCTDRDTRSSSREYDPIRFVLIQMKYRLFPSYAVILFISNFNGYLEDDIHTHVI